MSTPKLLPLSELIHIDFVSAAEGVTLTATTRRPAVACPSCGECSHRVHSRYTRKIAEAPWNRQRVTIRLRTRRWFCEAAPCPVRIFTEPLPGLVRRYARRTEELEEDLRLLAYLAGGEAGARLAQRFGITASPDTLLRQVRDRPPFVGPAPRVLGVDDWAFRRGRRYGTLLVDLEQKQPIELLEDRQANTLAAWLKAHPGAEIVSRDRSTGYAEAIRVGAPDAVQVADRWHLLKNLTEALERVVQRHHRDLREAAGAEDQAPKRARSQREQERQRRARERRLARYEEAVRLQQAGKTIQEIAAQLHLGRETISEYLQAGSFPERKEQEPRGAGKISCRRVLWWLVLPERRTEAQTAYISRLLARCPELRLATEAALEFFRLTRELKADELPQWEEQVQKAEIPELLRFNASLRKDWDAVVAGLSLPWSNGPTEGHVHRLKMVKRQMFGRANFELLRGRYLPLERPG